MSRTTNFMLSTYFNKKQILKIILISGTAMLSIIGCTNSSEFRENDSNKKIVRVEEQWVQPPPNFDTLILKSITQFNENGKPVDESSYSRFDGSVLINFQYYYDDHSNLTKKITDNREINQISEESFSYVYDKKGRKIKMLEKNATSVDAIEHTYTYNEDGTYFDTTRIQSQVIAVVHYSNNDKIIKGINLRDQSTVTNELDQHGNYTVRKISFADGPGNLSTYINEYDSLGNLIRKGLDNRAREYEFNENGDVSKETWILDNKPELVILYKYQYYE